MTVMPATSRDFEPFSPSSRLLHERATSNGWTLHANERNAVLEYRRKRGEYLRIYFSVRGAWYLGASRDRDFRKFHALLGWLGPQPLRPDEVWLRVRVEEPWMYMRSTSGILHIRRRNWEDEAGGPAGNGLSTAYVRCGVDLDFDATAIPAAVSADDRVCKRCAGIAP